MPRMGLIDITLLCRQMLDGVRGIYRAGVMQMLEARLERYNLPPAHDTSSCDGRHQSARRQTLVETEVDAALDLAFFPFLEQQASLAAQELTTPLEICLVRYSGGLIGYPGEHVALACECPSHDTIPAACTGLY